MKRPLEQEQFEPISFLTGRFLSVALFITIQIQLCILQLYTNERL